MGLLARIWSWLARRNCNAVSAESGTPPEKAEGQPVSQERRAFLAKLSVAVTGLGAVVVGIPVVGVLFSPLVRRVPEDWQPVGSVDDFRIGETVPVSYLDPAPLPWAGFAARNAAYVRREGQDAFVAFSTYCTHTGCPLRWVADARLFLCPCHGGAFHGDGSVAAGPPPTPLPRVPVRVRDGQVELRTVAVPLAE